jgi:hypothetical protein
MLPGCFGSIALVARNDPGRLGACTAPSAEELERAPDEPRRRRAPDAFGRARMLPASVTGDSATPSTSSREG